ncbi:MAG: phage tail protein [Polyangiaceae bacterium]
MPSRRAELDHVGSYSFMVEISGVAAGYFKGVDGLNAKGQSVSFQDGDDLFLKKLAASPGGRIEQVVMKQGSGLSSDLAKWAAACRDGQYDKRRVELVRNDNAGNETRRWSLVGCWPKQWKTGADPKSAEAIVFVVEDMQIA